MRAVVVYESMFGNTHLVAERIADGLRAKHETTVVPVGEASAELLAEADLVVVGGPTHAHGMSSSATRKGAVDIAEKDDELDLDPDAEGPDLRTWFDDMARGREGAAAAFDTRIDGPPAFTGRASKGIGKRLSKHGFRLVADSESFLVDKQHHLLEGEADRAIEWGVQLAAALATT